MYHITRLPTNHLLDSFDASSFPLPPSPNAPAPGPSLLDDHDSKFLDTFFDGMGSDDFNFDFFPSQRDGSDIGMGWTELPPTFMGTSSSFGQQPHVSSQHLINGNLNHGLNLHMPNTRPAVPTSAASDLLAAASYLHDPPNGHSQNMRPEMLFTTHGLPPVPSTNSHAQQSLSMYTPPRSDTDTSEPFKDNFYTDMVFGAEQHMTATGRQISIMHAKTDLRWGSDEAFGAPQGFVPPASQKKEVEAMQVHHIKAVQGVFREIPSSTDSMGSSSPLLRRLNTDQSTNSMGDYQEDDNDSRARKRRKSKFPDEDDDEDSPVSASYKNTKRKKVGKINDSSTPPHEQGHKRRKSSAAAAAAKATRENLTEDQKRENHIKSEQKRRTLIREGFEDLGELVPGLRGGGFSKSIVLLMSADWLQDLLQGNEILRKRLDQMHGR